MFFSGNVNKNFFFKMLLKYCREFFLLSVCFFPFIMFNVYLFETDGGTVQIQHMLKSKAIHHQELVVQNVRLFCPSNDLLFPMRVFAEEAGPGRPYLVLEGPTPKLHQWSK